MSYYPVPRPPLPGYHPPPQPLPPPLPPQSTFSYPYPPPIPHSVPLPSLPPPLPPPPRSHQPPQPAPPRFLAHQPLASQPPPPHPPVPQHLAPQPPVPQHLAPQPPVPQLSAPQPPVPQHLAPQPPVPQLSSPQPPPPPRPFVPQPSAPPLPCSTPPLPPPLPSSLPPNPPPPLPPTQPPDANSQFPPAPRGPDINQLPQGRHNYRHQNQPPIEQVSIPPLFPPKDSDLPQPKPLFPNISLHNEPPENFPVEPQDHYNRQTHGDQPHWNDQGERDRYFQGPPDQGFPPPREPWRDYSPPHGHPHNDRPLRGSEVDNFNRGNFYRDGSQCDYFLDDCRDRRFCESPPGPHFRPHHPNFRPPAPRPDLDGGPHDIGNTRGDCYHLSDGGHRLSPARKYYYDDQPPDLNFTPRSPGFDERPPEFSRDRPHDFNRPPDFESVTEFNRSPEFTRPPDVDRPRVVSSGDDLRPPSPLGFYHDNLVENFNCPPVEQRWSGNQNEGDVRRSPHRGGSEFHDPTDNRHRMPLLPTPLMGVADFPTPEVKTIMADKIFDPPGRNERPSHIVIIMRGLPGSGKSHIARLIRERELSHCAPAPRILSLDSYFLTEVEKTERDPDTGRRVKKRVQEYEYEPEMEQAYRASLLKAYNKTMEEGFFPMILVDAPNIKVHHFDRYWSNGKVKGFEVYIVELVDSIDICVARNIHSRTREDIEKLAREWEDTPPHFTRLDITTLLSDSNIDEVEMECTGSESEGEENAEKKSKSQSQSVQSTNQNPDGVVKSRWEDASEDRLDKLDAVGVFRKRKRLHSELEEEEDGELSLLEYLRRRDKKNVSGKKKKRVRWADLEAKKDEERKKREMGFCIGGSWGQVTEEEARAILIGTNTTDKHDT